MSIALRLGFILAPGLAHFYEGWGGNPVRRAIATTTQNNLSAIELARTIIRDCISPNKTLTPKDRLNHQAIEIYNDFFYAFPLSPREIEELKNEIKAELKAESRMVRKPLFTFLLEALILETEQQIM
jgi:hypothetical protein